MTLTSRPPHPALNPIPKVVAYITRVRCGMIELLVFDHRDDPAAGVQVPAGTVDSDEPTEAALWREVEEESGLTPAGGLTLVRWLATYRYWNESSGWWHQRHVYHLAAPADLPDLWEHTVSSGVDDAGLVFVYRWLPIAEAATTLAGCQGDWLHLLAA